MTLKLRGKSDVYMLSSIHNGEMQTVYDKKDEVKHMLKVFID